MGSRFGVWMFRLALVATLSVSLLPNGQVPKIAGPCGRSLCNCPLEVERVIPDAVCKKCVEQLIPSRVLTLGPSLFTGTEAPGLAFQSVFDCAETPLQTAVVPQHDDQASGRINAVQFSISQTVFEIPTPPPRA